MDFVCYDKDTKEIITVVYDVGDNPKFVININYVGICINHNSYTIEYEDGRGYFNNLDEKILYLDEYRGRYEE